MNLSDWAKIKEHFLVKCKHCKLTANYDSMGWTVMKYHLKSSHEIDVEEKEQEK